MNELMPSYNQGSTTQFSSPDQQPFSSKVVSSEWTDLLPQSGDPMNLIAELLQKALQGGGDQLETIYNLSQAIKTYNTNSQQGSQGPFSTENYTGDIYDYTTEKGGFTSVAEPNKTDQSSLFNDLSNLLSSIATSNGGVVAFDDAAEMQKTNTNPYLSVV